MIPPDALLAYPNEQAFGGIELACRWPINVFALLKAKAPVATLQTNQRYSDSRMMAMRPRYQC